MCFGVLKPLSMFESYHKVSFWYKETDLIFALLIGAYTTFAIYILNISDNIIFIKFLIKCLSSDSGRSTMAFIF